MPDLVKRLALLRNTAARSPFPAEADNARRLADALEKRLAAAGGSLGGPRTERVSIPNTRPPRFFGREAPRVRPAPAAGIADDAKPITLANDALKHVTERRRKPR